MAYQYKVAELREKMIGGKMSGEKLENLLNEHASQGWQLKAITAVRGQGSGWSRWRRRTARDLRKERLRHPGSLHPYQPIREGRRLTRQPFRQERDRAPRQHRRPGPCRMESPVLAQRTDELVVSLRSWPGTQVACPFDSGLQFGRMGSPISGSADGAETEGGCRPGDRLTGLRVGLRCGSIANRTVSSPRAGRSCVDSTVAFSAGKPAWQVNVSTMTGPAADSILTRLISLGAGSASTTGQRIAHSSRACTMVRQCSRATFCQGLATPATAPNAAPTSKNCHSGVCGKADITCGHGTGPTSGSRNANSRSRSSVHNGRVQTALDGAVVA